MDNTRVSFHQLASRPADGAPSRKEGKTKRVPPPLSSISLRRTPSNFSFRRLSVADRPNSAVGDWVKSVKKGVSDLRLSRQPPAAKADAATYDHRRSQSSFGSRPPRAEHHVWPFCADDCPSPSSTCLSSDSGQLSSLLSSAGLATPDPDDPRSTNLWADLDAFDVAPATDHKERQRSLHRRHRSSDALGHILRKASVVFSRSNPTAPVDFGSAFDDVGTSRQRLHIQKQILHRSSRSDTPPPLPPFFYPDPSSDLPSARGIVALERSSCNGLGLAIHAGGDLRSVSPFLRLPDQAELLPDGIVPSVAAFDLSILGRRNSLELSSSPGRLARIDAFCDRPAGRSMPSSSTSSSLASDGSSGCTLGSELGTPPLPSAPSFIDSVTLQESDTFSDSRFDVGSIKTKPPTTTPALLFPNLPAFAPSNPGAFVLKPCLVEHGSYQIPAEALTEADDWTLELAVCSWPLPPPRQTWYEVEAGTGRKVLRSALIDLQTGDLA